MADIAWQVEIDDGHNGVYVIENTCFTSFSRNPSQLLDYQEQSVR